MPFAKGVSGNPKGRPLGSRDEIGARIRADKACPERLVANLDRLINSKDENISLKATVAKIEFGWGRAPQAIAMVDGEGNFMPYSINFMIDPKLLSNGNGKNTEHNVIA